MDQLNGNVSSQSYKSRMAAYLAYKSDSVTPEQYEYYQSFYSTPNGATTMTAKMPKIENEKEFFKSLDKVRDDFRIPFVIAYVQLSNIYKLEISSNRAKTMKLNAHSMRENNMVKQRTEHASSKLNKFDFVPSYFNNCTSPAIKVAVALFLKPNYTETLKREFIISMINDTSSNTQKVRDIVELCRQSIADVRNYIKEVGNLSLPEKQMKFLMSGIAEVSDIVRDRPCAKLAMHIDTKKYITFVTILLESDHLKSTIPCEPLINLYLTESVARCNKDDERNKLINQIRVDTKQTMRDVIQGLPTIANKVSTGSTKACVFKPDQQYQYYKGVPNYTRDIITTYHIENGRRYRIQTYNDCLYDVLGYTNEMNSMPNTQQENLNNSNNSSSNNKLNNGYHYNTNDQQALQPQAYEYEIYDRMSWADRLNLVRFRTKIRVEEAKGSELNDYNGGSTDITISWFDDNDISCSKTISIKKTDVKKRDSEKIFM